MTKQVEIFTDGACSGNPGPGGWGAILRFNGKTKELSGGEAETTNNRMELLAAISALNALKEPCAVELHTDSKYVMDGISKWIHGWKKNGWKTADKKPVKNGELWQALDEANRRHKVTWNWVKGHAGHTENERADELAREGMAPFKKGAGQTCRAEARSAEAGGIREAAGGAKGPALDPELLSSSYRQETFTRADRILHHPPAGSDRCQRSRAGMGAVRHRAGDGRRPCSSSHGSGRSGVSSRRPSARRSKPLRYSPRISALRSR